MKYRKRPVIIEAFQLGADYFPDWFTDAVTANDVILRGSCGLEDVSADIKTLEGVMRADNKDFIIQGINGEIYPCKPDVFKKTYEPAAGET